MVSEEEFAEWLREEWAVVPDPNGGYSLNDYTGTAWRIIMLKDLKKPTSPTLGERYEDESTARHIARCHNYWLSAVKARMAGTETDADPASTDDRALES